MAEFRGRKQHVSAQLVADKDVSFIKDLLTEMNGKLNGMEISLMKLNQTVIGSKEYGHKGLVERVDEHQKYIEEDRKYKAKVVGGVTVVGFIYALLLKYWEKIF